MDELCDLNEICDIKPFAEIDISTDDDEPMPKISGVGSIGNEALPMASRKKYKRTYQDFKKWQKERNASNISESLLLEYFQELSVKQKPTSLWSCYSMLKRTLQVNLNTDIGAYNQVLGFLKTLSSGYEPVKSKSFTENEVVKFVFEAPDKAWLDIKVVCIFGVCGSLKNGELRSIKTTDVEQHGDLLLVKIEDSHTKTVRSFTITGKFCTVVKKYMALRPPNSPEDRFFLNYQREKCTIQPIGKNKLARMPQKIAQYLSLPEPDRYTGQAFRLSGKLILKNTKQTIDGRIMETIERTYSSHSNTSQFVDMIEQSSHDSDCKSECEETEPEVDGRFCGENLLKVDNLRLHCTTCDTHIGCAVANEGNVRTHPILFVTQCRNCHTYYNRRDFTKGEDGSELQCRWCAQGGEVYSCSKCPHVFCRKCILQNLSKNVITEIESNDEWQCFSCSPNVISHLRSQHWALTNHIRQTKNQIRGMKDADQLYELMVNNDLTLCCKGKGPLNSRQNPKDRRRPCSSNDCSTPEPKRIRDNSVVCIPIQPTEESRTPATVRLSHRMPTILSQKSVSPPPLILRQLPSPSEPPSLKLRPIHSLTSARPTSPLKAIDLPLNSSALQNVSFPITQLPSVADVTSPGFTYNILVDLATREDTYVRLPNGKLIQVRPQSMHATEPTHQIVESPQQAPPVLIQNYAPHATTNQAPSAQISHKSSRQIINVSQGQQQSLQQHRHQSTAIQQQPSQQQHSLQQRQPLQPQPPFQQRQHLQPQQSLQKHQTPNIQQPKRTSNAPTAAKPQTPRWTSKQFPNSPLGQAQTELEKQIHGTQEICQQIIRKCNTLMKSKAYNSVQGCSDVRDLHQHLSYLFSYGIDRFTTLKTKSIEAMQSLTNADVATKKLVEIEASYMNVDDDVQVVETVTECIEIGSDDETEHTQNSVPVGVAKTQSYKTSHQVKSNVQAPTAIIGNTDNDEFELPIPPPMDTDNESYDRENDEKLKGTPFVVLEKNEEIERKMQEILERQKSENDFASQVNDVINHLMDTHKTVILVSDMVGGEDKNDSVPKDHQAKVERLKEGTKSDDCNKINPNRYQGSKKFGKVIDRNKHEIDVGFVNSTDAQNEDKDSASVNGSVNRFNLSLPQSSQITGNGNIDLLDGMDHRNNRSQNSFANISSSNGMSRNKAAENFVLSPTENADPDLV